ncbi:MAG TPA: glycosyltransferase family 39 protein [Pirellulales bacterium]|nr:glycosyltransferase family 39 protein [Pirellulales bacterium]
MPPTSILRPDLRVTRPLANVAQQPVGPASREDWLSPRRQERLIWACVGLALAARAVRYLVCFPLWEDECFLVSNLIDAGYAKLLDPLNYHQVAPLLFLWLELTSVKLLGFSEWSLRLFPFACGVGSLILFRHLARRLLRGPARLLAVAAFCASYSGIRYAAEAKPYGPDQLVALLLLAAAVEWSRSENRGKWLLALVGLLPVAVGLSYPAVFVAGGISLFMALELILQPRVERRRDWTCWLAYNGVLAGSFLTMLRFAAKSQSDSELGWMQDYWKDHLPSLASPLEFVLWFFKTHTGDLLAIPLGGEHGASTITFLLVTLGVGCVVRNRRYRVLTLCLAPAGLNLVAAMLGRFPYGGHVKFSQYLAPAICLLLGIGAAALISAGRGGDEVRRRCLRIALVVLALIPLGTMARDFVCPYKSSTDARYRDFARWFWPSMQFAGETACLHTDLGLEFAPGTFHHLGWSAMYVCNQRIYSPRHRLGKPVNWQRISADWPLHCVEYRAEVYPYDESAQQAWLNSMGERYELLSRDVFPSPVYQQRGSNLLCCDKLVLYKFAPRR